MSLAQNILGSGVEIHAKFPFPEITFSPRHLPSILYNLISNAIKFRLIDKPMVIVISTESKPDYAIISIRDIGIGIDPKRLDNSFKKYVRPDSNYEGLAQTFI